MVAGHDTACRRLPSPSRWASDVSWCRATVAVRAACAGALGVVVALGTGGCVGLVRTSLDWAPVSIELRTKAEVLARFGEPRRRAREDGRETWYYDLGATGPSGQQLATEGATILYLLVAPLWWRDRVDANVRFAFDGDAVASTAGLMAAEHGFFCGFNAAAEHFFLCGAVP
jgi:hypothetical protein